MAIQVNHGLAIDTLCSQTMKKSCR